jgi:hypothetical protein
MSSLGTILAVAAAMALALALAYLPMRLLLTHMAKNIRSFMQRQRDRRTSLRETPDRRKTAEPGAHP